MPIRCAQMLLYMSIRTVMKLLLWCHITCEHMLSTKRNAAPAFVTLSVFSSLASSCENEFFQMSLFRPFKIFTSRAERRESGGRERFRTALFFFPTNNRNTQNRFVRAERVLFEFLPFSERAPRAFLLIIKGISLTIFLCLATRYETHSAYAELQVNTEAALIAWRAYCTCVSRGT